MEEARLRTNLILIKNYEDQRVFASCLMFSELMNADTFRLKLNVHLMKILTDFYKKRGTEETQALEKSSKANFFSIFRTRDCIYHFRFIKLVDLTIIFILNRFII